MRRRRATGEGPSTVVRGLRWVPAAGGEEGGVQLAWAGGHLRMTPLAADLYRLEVRPLGGRGHSRAESFAVVKRDWARVETRVQRRRGRLEVRGPEGVWRVELATGAWELRDRWGLRVFEGSAGGLAFRAGQARVELNLADREILQGLGEMTGPLNRRGLIRELWNVDVLGHAPGIHPGLRSMYASIPFILSMRDGRVAGLFWDDPGRQVWDLGATDSERWVMEGQGGAIDLFLFLGPTPGAVVERYTELTGRMPLPPWWALGYHQSRYSYESRRELEAVARQFRRRQIPCDALYLDIDHLRGHRVFTFGRSFPRPAEMLRRLRGRGFRVVTIVDPGVKDDAGFGVLRRGRRREVFVKAPTGRRDFIGEVWPGRSRFPDFLDPAVRGWWGEEQARVQRLGVAGFWNDMNEPANFARADKTLDPGCWHRLAEGRRVRHATVHNVYGMAMAQASWEGARRAAPQERPFIITRAAYAGIQRHAVVWTGDTSSCWEHLAESVRMLLSLGLSGAAFCGGDVGGFLEHCTGELFVRWTQMAAFTPFFRNHANVGTRRQEPWAFGPEVESICRRYIEVRYQLLPYLQGLFVEAHRRGTPVMRPMGWQDPNDPVAVACEDQFLLGRSLLVAPVLRPGVEARSVYLPAGGWYDAWTGQAYGGRQHVVVRADLGTLPLFVRAGSLVPMAAVRQHVAEETEGVVTLHVWPGADGELDWYEDNGRGETVEESAVVERRIAYQQRRGQAQLEWGAERGPGSSAVRVWRVIRRATEEPRKVRCNGRTVPSVHVAELSLMVTEVENASGPMDLVWGPGSERRRSGD